ncbi:MAG TPA: hypothetical protein PLQ09_02105 [Prolixibacteraceae bacterium]|nr:hypothetical protein [Prolixibacteraceae bacterium]HQN92886.1 hypothetical protein [Prolixibacteraceae bacterium]
MIKRLKEFTLPLAILMGFLFHGFFSTLGNIIPWLIFVMLYLTLCSVDMRKIRPSKLHLWILAFQVLASISVYFLILPFNKILAQGALVLLIAPTATSAPVIANMLGANINTMVTSTLLSNLAVAAVSPLYFSWAGIHGDLPFWESSWMVLSKVAPLLIVPLVLAYITQRYTPKLSEKISKYKNASYYLWAISLTVVIGRTIDSIFQLNHTELGILLAMTILSIVLCIVQFGVGRFTGKLYGETIAGGQSAGQKNTVLAIWMAQTYMTPISSVIPAMYVLWQNLFNSYQIWNKNRREHRR